MSTKDIQEIVIDEEFENMIPPLTQEEFAQLEKNLEDDGCRDPIVVWNSFIIDGHNRYKICTKHSIDFSVTEKHFKDREEVRVWIDKNQLGRRNLKADQVSLIRGRYYNRIKKSEIKDDANIDAIEEKAAAIELAKRHGVSKSTIERDGQYAYAIEKVKIIEPRIEHRVLEGKAPSKAKIIKAATLSQESPENAKALLEGKKSLRDLKQEERELSKTLKSKSLPKEKFDVLYLQFSPSEMDIESKDAKLLLSEICDLNIKEITEENAVLFLWSNNLFLENALKICTKWGFKYQANLVWIKENPVEELQYKGLENQQHDLLLICTKGEMEPTNKLTGSLIESNTQTVHQVIEELYPDATYIQLLSKEDAGENWKIWNGQ